MPSPCSLVQLRSSTTRAHPGVNLDHDGNYCPGVQPVGGEEEERGVPVLSGKGGVKWALLPTDLGGINGEGRAGGEGGSGADPSISILTEFQLCRSLCLQLLLDPLMRDKRGRGGGPGQNKAFDGWQTRGFLSPQRSRHTIKEDLWVLCCQLTVGESVRVCSVLQCSSDKCHLSGIYGCSRKRMSSHRARHCICGICLFSRLTHGRGLAPCCWFVPCVYTWTAQHMFVPPAAALSEEDIPVVWQRWWLSKYFRDRCGGLAVGRLGPRPSCLLVWLVLDIVQCCAVAVLWIDGSRIGWHCSTRASSAPSCPPHHHPTSWHSLWRVYSGNGALK